MKVRITPARLWFAFAALILLTRSTHLAFSTALPDATVALMLLGGMWVRRWPGFAGLMAAVFAADWLASGTLGVPDDCFTPAYAGLVPAYLAVWSAGSWLQAKWPRQSLLPWLGTMLVSSAAAFALSNAFWYAFSGRFDGWPAARFAAEVVRYYPAYAGTGLGYVTLAWLVCLAARHLVRSHSLGAAA